MSRCYHLSFVSSNSTVRSLALFVSTYSSSLSWWILRCCSVGLLWLNWVWRRSTCFTSYSFSFSSWATASMYSCSFAVNCFSRNSMSFSNYCLWLHEIWWRSPSFPSWAWMDFSWSASVLSRIWICTLLFSSDSLSAWIWASRSPFSDWAY